MPDRYDRQIRVKEIGVAGQKRLREACVAVIGVGALGGHMAMMLTRLGIGKLILIDGDRAEMHNLHRQVLYDEDDVRRGDPKVLVAKERLHKINGEVELVAHAQRLTAENAEAFLAGADVLMDGTDNFPTRMIVNDAAVKTKRPLVHGAVLATSGTVFVVPAGGKPCLACLYPELPPADEIETTETAGIFPCAPGLVAQWQVTEAVKLILGLTPRQDMLLHDLWSGEFLFNQVAPNPNCLCCGQRRFIHLFD